MIIRARHAVAVAVAVVAISGCGKPAPTPTASAASAGPQASGPLTPLSPTSFTPLSKCPSALVPNRAFVLNIKNLNVKRLPTPAGHDRGFLEYPVEMNGKKYEGDTTSNATEPADAGASNYTRWDVYLNLASSDVALIEVTVDKAEQDVKLRGDKYTVLIDPAVASSKPILYCMPDWGSNQTDKLVFEAQYNGSDGSIPKSLNIGFIVSDGDKPQYTTPIFIDPNVKNNG